MSNAVEYLFAADLPMADRAARRQGWHPHGQSGWIKPDGMTVVFICFPEQVAVTGKEATIYFLGDLLPEMKRFDRKWTKLRA